MPKIKYIFPNIEISSNVAIVGSSSNLLNSNYSKLIDSHEDVIRYNRAPMQNYESIVGSKCTIRICNHHVFQGLPTDKRFTKEGQPTNFIKNLKNTKIIIANGNSEYIWNNRENKIDQTCEAFYIKEEYINILKNKFNLHKHPSVGFIGIMALVDNKIIPNIFGFGFNENSMTHYWEDRNPTVHHHDFSQEREILKDFENKKLLKIFL